MFQAVKFKILRSVYTVFLTFDSTFVCMWVKAYLRDEHFLKTPTVLWISGACLARKKNSPTYQSAIIEPSGHFGLRKL